MKANFGHLAIVLLLIFTIATLGLAAVNNYQLASLDSDLFNNRLSVGCVERFSGLIKLKQPVDGAKVLLSLSYHLVDGEAERSVLPTDGHYSVSVRGQPEPNQTWTIRAYYFNQTGQLAETAQEFNNLSCDQQIEANVEL